MTGFIHYPVMLKEVLYWLNCKKGLIYIDGTLGGGGHSSEIAKLIYPEGKIIGFEIDPTAIETAKTKLEPYKEIVSIVNLSYTLIPETLKNINISKITGGVLLDLGASYYQLTSEARGFSFSKEAPLDMRFNPDSKLSAYDIINGFEEKELYRIFKEYGEERFPGRIAKKIAEQRKKKNIETTVELANIIISCIPHYKSKIHPATKVFQALRIAVNNELENTEKAIKCIIPLLEKNARIVVISFHSLEDRLVKKLFKYYSSECKCPTEQLICKCEPSQIEILTKKPIIASEEEIKINKPSRSAKIRVARKII